MHVKSFGTILWFIYLIVSTIAKLFCKSVEWFAAIVCDWSQHGRLLSPLLPSNDKSAFCSILRVPPSLLFWSTVFFPLPSANPEPDDHQASCHSSSLWNARKKLHDLRIFVANVLLWLSLVRSHTPLLSFISVAVICNLSTPSHENHGCLEKLKDSFGSEAQAATGASCHCLFMLWKPSCEHCCSNQHRNKHTINLFAYQLSREP